MTISACSPRSAVLPRRKMTSLFLSSLLSKVSWQVQIFVLYCSHFMIGWKRLLLADGPRQSINALTLYSFYLSKLNDGPVLKLSKYSDNFITSTLLVVMLFTVLVFVLSMLLLIAAGICYVPLLCYIRGNLKVCYYQSIFDVCANAL